MSETKTGADKKTGSDTKPGGAKPDAKGPEAKDRPNAKDGPLPAGADEQQAAPSLRVLAQYLKDQSFENPNAPQSFQDTGAPPAINVGVDVNARPLGDNQYEVELSISAQAKRGEDIAFVIETTYAGAFEVLNIPNDQVEGVLLVECPRLLFPFVRQIIADTTISGNFPPILLDPVDFLAVYQQRVTQAQQAQPAAQA